MSTIVEFIAAIVISLLGISEEKPPEEIAEVIVIECCEIEPSSSTDMLKITHISSIKIEHNRTENTLL